MSDQQEYQCAVSGLEAESIEGVDNSDGLGSTPLGWTRVTLQRRVVNPEWVLLQEAKRNMVESGVAQMQAAEFTQEMMAAQVPVLNLQVAATFHSMEKDTPMFLVEKDEVYISDDLEVLEAMNEIRAQLGLEALEFDLADESDLPHDSESGDGDDDAD